MKKIITLFLTIIFVLTNSFGYASMPCCQNKSSSEVTYQPDNITHNQNTTINTMANCHSHDNHNTKHDNNNNNQCNHANCSVCVKPVLLNTHYNISFIIQNFTVYSDNILYSLIPSPLYQPPKSLFV